MKEILQVKSGGKKAIGVRKWMESGEWRTGREKKRAECGG